MVKDMLGRNIKKGDYIAYPGRRSSSLWLNYGKVVGFNRNPIKGVYGLQLIDPTLKVMTSPIDHWGDKRTSRVVEVIQTDRVVVLDKATIPSKRLI